MSLFNWISELSIKERLGENAHAFISEITYINLVRIKIMSMAAFVIFIMLWIWDIIQFFDGKWNESVGFQIVTCVHSFLIFFLIGIQIFCWKKFPENADSINTYHKIFINTVAALVLICAVFLALGDVLTNGSIAAYLGMVFAYAAIFVMTNVYSFFLYGINMIVMVFLLVLVYLRFKQPMDIQVINAVAFTIAAFIMSRILFYYSLKDFINRLLINKQSFEIEQQNEVKEKLIIELSQALAEVKTLGGLLPICAQCKKIRDDKGYWTHVESYIEKHSDAQFSHGICDECSDKLYGNEDWYGKKKENKP